jgi:hypothetical protein
MLCWLRQVYLRSLGHNIPNDTSPTLEHQMQQTKLGSLIESVMNIIIGYGIALLSQILIFPLFDIHISLSTNLWIGFWFTLISLIRSYVIRRWFNARLHKAALQLAESIEAPASSIPKPDQD